MNVKLVGTFVKYIEAELMPGEEFFAERGALIYVDEGIEFNTELSGNSLGSLIGAKLSGEALTIVRYRNCAGSPRRLTAGSRCNLLHLKLDGSEFLAHRGAFVASSRKVEVTSRLSIAGLLGGMGGILQKISCPGATVFLGCYGDPVAVDIPPGRTMRFDEKHIIALVGIPEGRISAGWGLQNVLGGEGLSLLSVTGPGRVYVNP